MNRSADTPPPSNEAFYLEGWLVQPDQLKIHPPGREPVTVEPKVMEVLLCLAAHPGGVVSRDTLLEVVWPDAVIVDDTLTRCISQLRKVFEDAPRQPRFIETIRKRGYRLKVPPRLEAAPSGRGPARRAPMPRPRRRPAGRAVVLLGLCLAIYGVGWYTGARQAQPDLPWPKGEQPGFVFLDSADVQRLEAGGENTFVHAGKPRQHGLIPRLPAGDSLYVWYPDPNRP